MNRLPIRLRLTLAFIVSVALILTLTGAFIYVRTASNLLDSIDQGLRARAQDLAATIGPGGGSLRSIRFDLIESDEVYAQVLTPDGGIADGTASIRSVSVLSGPQLQRALRSTTIFDREVVPGFDAPTRALATPLTLQERPSVLVVGASLADRQDALNNLRNQFLIGGPIALLLLSFGGYLMSRAALRPIDGMRRRAEVLSAKRLDERLPVAAANDEVRQLGETLNAMLDRLQDALVRERRLLTDAGHELRTPLALLKTELELALRDGGSTADLHESIRSAVDETDRLSHLADNLLVLTQEGRGSVSDLRLDVDLGAVVEVVRARFAPAFERVDRALSVEASAGQHVRIDSLELEQVLTNMLDNALHHGAGATTLTVGSQGGPIEVHVQDQGPGVPEAFLPLAFEPFARADEARSRPGAGLGLAIIHRIVERWGGTAQITNRPDGGVDVSFTLPRWRHRDAD